MAATIKEVKEWLDNLDPDSTVAIDDENLIEIDVEGEETGELIEIGGAIPD